MGKKMGKTRQDKLNDNRLMWKKVNYIYEHLFHHEVSELVESLSDESLLKKASYRGNRKKAFASMLRKQRVDKERLEKIFPSCKISKWMMNGQPLFDKRLFFESDIDTFKNRIDQYVTYLQKASIGLDLSYRYIYMFDHSNHEEVIHNVNNIVYYEVNYAESKNLKTEEGLPVTVTPPVTKKYLGSYKGRIYTRGKQLVLVYENSDDSVHIVFNTALATSSVNPLFDDNYYGLAIGIDDANGHTPVAKKVVFSKRRFSDEEKEQLYLILNETQRLEAKENIYALDPAIKIDADHIGKYQRKIKDIHTFFSNVKYSNAIDTSIMHHMVFTEFHVFQRMFDKFARQQDYFLHDRKRVYLEFVRYLQFHPHEEVQMVMPLSDASENIFLFQAPGDKKTLLTLFRELVTNGLVLEIVFVIKKREDYRNEAMREVCNALDSVGVKLSFVEQRAVEFLVDSYDFCCTKQGKDAVFKGRSSYRNMFTVTRNSEKVKSLRNDFQTIRQLSAGYEAIRDGKEIIGIDDAVLKKLVGAWYLYFYGSFNSRDGEAVFWEVALDVRADYSVVENAPVNRVSSGTVEIFQKQTLFSLVSQETGNTLFITMTNNKIADVMSVMLCSKQDQRNLDMAMIGIMSHEKLMKEEVQGLLGTQENNILKVDPMLQIRIDEFILAHRSVSNMLLK